MWGANDFIEVSSCIAAEPSWHDRRMLSVLLLLASRSRHIMATTTTTTALLDVPSSREQNSLTRLRITHAENSRSEFIVALANASAARPSDLRILVGEAWLTDVEFLEIATRLPRFVRCLHLQPDSGEVALLPWRKFGSVTFGEGKPTDLRVSGHAIKLGHNDNAGSDSGGDSGVGPDTPHGATGRTLWDGAVLLASYIDVHPEAVRGLRVIELGAGQGLVGVAAALAGAAAVTLTDLEYALPGCRRTVAANAAALAALPGPPAVAVAALDWFAPPADASYTVILAADVVWLTELVAPFVRTLAALCPHGGGQTVLLSYQRRGKDADAALWAELARHGFHVDGPVPFEPIMDGEGLAQDGPAPGLAPGKSLGKSYASSNTEIGLFLLSRGR